MTISAHQLAEELPGYPEAFLDEFAEFKQSHPVTLGAIRDWFVDNISAIQKACLHEETNFFEAITLCSGRPVVAPEGKAALEVTFTLGCVSRAGRVLATKLCEAIEPDAVAAKPFDGILWDVDFNLVLPMADWPGLIDEYVYWLVMHPWISGHVSDTVNSDDLAIAQRHIAQFYPDLDLAVLVSLAQQDMLPHGKEAFIEAIAPRKVIPPVGLPTTMTLQGSQQ